jgi:hypothetical protein
MVRSFECPATEMPCDRPGCKKGLCIAEEEDAARRHEALSNRQRGEFAQDEMDREMLDLAKSDLTSLFREQRGRTPSKEELEIGSAKLLRMRWDEYAKRARANLRERERLGRLSPDDLLRDLGLL